VVDVPVPAGSPAAGGATVIPIPAPPAPGGGWGAPAVAPPAPATALPPAPIILPPLPRPTLAPHPGPFRKDERSLADRANAQLRRDRKDPLAQGVEDAGRDDCLHAPKDQRVGGLLNAPILAARALGDKCAK
jgi:hypothetical protein